MKVEITQIRAFQPPGTANLVGTGQADQPFEGFIKGRAPFELEIRFDLIGETGTDLTKEPAVYSAQAYVQDTSTGENTLLGDTAPETLIKGKRAYTATLPELTLAPGTYRLFALVTLQATSIKPHFITLPVFKVR
jgi:hypothetical protein